MSIEAMKQARAFIDDVFQGEWNGSHDHDSILAKLDAAIEAAEKAEPVAEADDAYDMIDRFLRNNLDDADYAEYSEALEAVYHTTPQQPRQESEIAAEALEEAAKMIDMDDLAWERPAAFLRALAAKKREQAK